MSSSHHTHWRRCISALRLTALWLTAGLVWASASVADTPAGTRQLVDPTRPPHFQRPSSAALAAAQSPLTLRAIVVSEGRRVAVIDGRHVQPGDRIGDVEVVAIDPYQVRLKAGNGKTFTLRLVEKPIDKRKVEPKESQRKEKKETKSE